MELQKARQKLANFEVEIRRSYRDRVFRQIREELTMPQAELVNKVFRQFVDNKPSQIPEICLYNYKHIELSLLQQLMSAMQNKQVSYASKSEDKWYIDCSAVINLKFMTLEEVVSCPNIIADFYRETVRINYAKISGCQLALKNKRQGCLFSLVENQASGELELPQIYKNGNSQNMQYEVGLLNFWSAYIQNSQDSIPIDMFIQMIKVFQLQTQFNDMLLKRQASIFIKTILEHIKQSNIMAYYVDAQSKHYQLAQQCYSFIVFIRMKLPFLIKKAVDYRLAYYQIAQILYKIYHLSNHINQLFITCVTEIQSLNYFIILLLRDESAPQDTNLNHKAALLVINCVAEYGIFDLLYLNQAINITRQLVNVTLFTHTTQHLCSLVLFNIIDRDREKYLLKIFELLDYETLLNNLQEGSYSEVYELLILILENYHKSDIICTKILIHSQFISHLKKYVINKDIEKLLQQLTRVVRIHLDYFLDKYPKIMIELYQFIKEHDFSYRDECVKELQAHFQLDCKQKEL